MLCGSKWKCNTTAIYSQIDCYANVHPSIFYSAFFNGVGGVDGGMDPTPVSAHSEHVAISWQINRKNLRNYLSQELMLFEMYLIDTAW